VNLHSARKLLPLFHRIEERAGERRSVLLKIPLSPKTLSPLVPRREREKIRYRRIP
jgi:hypothetical protein